MRWNYHPNCLDEYREKKKSGMKRKKIFAITRELN